MHCVYSAQKHNSFKDIKYFNPLLSFQLPVL